MYNDRFFIMGNGGSGTSLLRGLLNAHSQIDCAFEKINIKEKYEFNNSIWTKLQRKSNNVWWGNKVPFEQFITGKWTDDDIKEIADNYWIIWIVRRFSRYSHKAVGHRLNTYMVNWDRAQRLYFEIKNEHPETAILVSFEDLILHTEVELKRICNFLNIKFEKNMMDGTKDPGYKKYNQLNINLEKV